MNAVPTLANRYGLTNQASQIYDLKNPDTLTQFKKVGINFLLITTVEDMDENHIDGATVTRDFEYCGTEKQPDGGWQI